jgi:hypothetical protein
VFSLQVDAFFKPHVSETGLFRLLANASGQNQFLFRLIERRSKFAVQDDKLQLKELLGEFQQWRDVS